MSSENAKTFRSRLPLNRTTTIFLAVFFVIAVIVGVAAFLWSRNFFATWTMTSIGDAPAITNNNNSAGNNASSGDGTNNSNAPSGPTTLQRDTDPTPTPWDGTSRVTLLIMGLDYRDWSEGADVPRTDSMILFTIDPMTKSAGMLSIPRDMWVSIPGMGYNKINTAYRWGELYKLPGGGPGLAMKTVEQFIGVPVNYYALIDFNAFVKFIDELGGLDMKIREPITVDPIGPGNTRVIQPGSQALDGATVLAYARQRHTANDDFDRSKRQQEVIMAIRKQILQFNMLPELITKSPKLYEELSSGINTNLTLDQVIKLAVLATQIDENSIKKGVIGPPTQVEFATNPADGQQILIPVPDQIRILRDDIFATGGQEAQAGAGAGDPAQLMKEENARVAIKNGTTQAGIASKASEILKPLGVNIVSEENASESYGLTTIKDYSGKPYTIQYLIDQLKLPESRVVISSYDPNAAVDIEIYLGNDWAATQPQ
jgi:LCP family protein required for cell wall assembly